MAHFPIRFGKFPIKQHHISFNLRDSVAAGMINEAISVQKFGENAAAGATEEYLWSESGAYTWMTAAQKLKVASVGADAGNDDGDPQGTGAWTVELQGLDADWNLQTETVTMNGTTQVATTNDFIRCFRAKVVTAGSGGGNDEPIHIYDNGGANQVAHIPAEYNQTMQAIYTVPANYTAWLLRWYASSASNQTVDVFLRAKDNTIAGFPTLGQVKHKIHIFRGYADEKFDIPIQFTEKTDIWMSTIASASSDVAGGFDLIMLKTGE